MDISKNELKNILINILKTQFECLKLSSSLDVTIYISILSEKYKKNPLFWILGGIRGAISNFKASKTGEFSSLIYIIKKK